MTTAAYGEIACIAGVSRDCGHGIFRLEGRATRSQSKRATNCANPGFLVIEFCARCGQTCGHGDFLTTSTCGGSACIAGVSRDCGHSIFQLEGGATRTQSKRATNCANPGYSAFNKNLAAHYFYSTEIWWKVKRKLPEMILMMKIMNAAKVNADTTIAKPSSM